MRDQLQTLREERAEAQRAVASAREAWAANGGQADKSDPSFLAAEAAVTRLNSVEQRLDMAQGAERDLLRVLAGSDGRVPAVSFLANPEVMQQVEQIAQSNTRLPTLGQGGVSLGQYLSAEEMAQRIGVGLDAPTLRASIDDSGAPSLGQGPNLGIVPQLTRPLRFLDLMPTQVVDAKTFDYVVESFPVSGSPASGAEEVVEGAIKPEAGVVYTDETASVATIAHWLKVNRAQLADAEDLERRLRDRLTYGVLLRLEGQVIGGDGQNANIEGILVVSGTQDVSYSASALLADQLLAGIAKVLLVGANPNVIALSVNDYVSVISEKASGSGEFLNASAPFGGSPAPSIWGVPLVAVPNMDDGNALVGDTRLGGRVLVREGVNVVLGQESDDMVRNRVTLLGEGRYGLTVDNPAAWCVVDLAA